MIIPIHFHNLLNIILGVHIFIVCFILYGVHIDGKKSLTYPVTRFQLLVLVGIIWFSILVLVMKYNENKDKNKKNVTFQEYSNKYFNI
tara:strand:- start:831 stop:1094 length:264 start_codon:yes stop_codon:yes gene_type:complete